MRIRKNAKLSPLWFSHPSAPEALQTHVCQLNQSPWDAISFAQDSNQFEGEDSFTGNASLGDSVGADESVASMMDAVAAKAEDMAMDDNDNVKKREKAIEHGKERMKGNEFELQKGERISSCCQKTDGKGWQCRNEAKEGQSLCEHHLNLLRSYNNSNLSLRRSAPAAAAAVAAAAAAAAGARRARARAAKKGGRSSSSNPYEFYYYSGFGPLWGRKRGHRGGGSKHIEPKRVDSNNATTTTITTTTSTASISNTSQSTPSSSSQLDNNEDFEYVDDEDDDDEEDEAAIGDSGKKRMRKPVKARSLKSLM